MATEQRKAKRAASFDAGTPEKKQRSDPEQIATQTTTTTTSTDVEIEGSNPDRPVRVYADGIYDLFHFGHARSLEQAKKIFPNTHLIVGVCSDELTHRLKGRTVMFDYERAESLRHCRYVDEVVENAPWIVTMDFIEKHKIDYVAHGEDIILGEDGEDIYKLVKDAGKYKTIKRTDGISTSDIILRIVKDYDNYVRRNLARGYTGKQMNVGYVKQKQIQMEDNIKKFKDQVNNRVSKVQNWSKSHNVRLLDFIKRFGGRVETMLTDSVGSDDEYMFSPESIQSPKSPEEQEEEPPHV